MVKPAWKKLESYLVIAMCTGMMALIPVVLGDVQSLGIPAQWAMLLAGILATASSALVGYFAKLRHDAYANAGLADPNQSALPQTLSGAVSALNK